MNGRISTGSAPTPTSPRTRCWTAACRTANPDDGHQTDRGAGRFPRAAVHGRAGPDRQGPRLGSGHAAEGQLPLRCRVGRAGRRVQRLQQGQRGLRAGTQAGRRVHRRLADPRGSAVRNGGARLPGRHPPFTDAGMDVVGIRDNPRFSIQHAGVRPEARRRRPGMQPAAERVPRGIVAAGQLPRQGGRDST